MKAKKIIVSVTNDLYTDQRVRKVCEFLVENGFELTLVGRKLPNSHKMPELPYKIKRFPLWFKKGPLFYATYNLRLFWFLLFHKADVLLSNDLDTLLANHWARKFKSKCQLIYDSHEYYTETPELVNRPKVQRFWKKIERKCLPKVDAMYTVNESIAQLYRDEYNVDVKVVRNISDRKGFTLSKTRNELGLPEDKKVVIMQGAGINIQRGAEEMVQAIQKVNNAVLAIVGDGDVVPQLKEEVKQNNWSDKVLFFGKQPYDILLNYTALADVGVAMDKATNLNYKLALGNKIFDYIHCSTPLFVSDLPEIARIVNEYQIGVVCPSHNVDEIATLLNAMLEDENKLEQYKSNTLKAANDLTWENEQKVLSEIYLNE
ncbi:glycosyltransferase [Paracrocinitomix mangrovi]|uniref:glycosyltransferase n=1 Tax=Paracrocinitomix mangrovi TaxID=2862509 RepID=UPI001C8E9C5C|nr:glycosyltransferase [Paracrocinitomix mangrovi]UKN00995.1 glycosyltransferase [Paracrocinitomix mangrovi]